MTLLDIVQQLTKELRWNAAFRTSLRDCDQAAEQRITASFLAWVHSTLETENNIEQQNG
jgi:hypothetical protein